MKKSNNTALNNNETEIFHEQYYRELRQKYGVELSGLQQGFYHVIYGKQMLVNKNLNLNYNPQYGIYTGFSLLLLLFVLVIIVTYYKIKQKIRTFIEMYLTRRNVSHKKSFDSSPNSDKGLVTSNEIVQLIVSSKTTDLQLIQTMPESNESSLESIQKSNKYNLTPYVDHLKPFTISTHSMHNMHNSWNSLSVSNYNCTTPSDNSIMPKDFDSLSIKTAVEFPNPNAFSLNTTIIN